MIWTSSGKFPLFTKYFDRLNNVKYLPVEFAWLIPNVATVIWEIANDQAKLIKNKEKY